MSQSPTPLSGINISFNEVNEKADKKTGDIKSTVGLLVESFLGMCYKKLILI